MDHEEPVVESAVPDDGSDFISAAKRFIILTARKKRLSAEIDGINEELERLQEPLCQKFLEDGVRQIKVDGATLSIRRDMFPALIVPDGGDRDEIRLAVVHQLEKMGHTRMVTYNHSSLRSLVNELADDDGEIPAPLGDFLKIEERFKITATGVKAGAA